MSANETLAAAQLTARLVTLAELYPAPWNPREITEERLLDLRRSMDADPTHLWARPLMRREDGMVIAGNHRLLAAGLDPPYDALPAVDVPGLSDDEAMVIALRDNENYAVWRDADVAAILDGLSARGIDLSLTGFSAESVTSLLDGFAPPDAPGAPDPDDAPVKPRKPRSKRGEVYELGTHRLICGDAADPKVIETLMGDSKIDMLWTDPPYGVSYVGKTAAALTIQNDGDGAAALLADVLEAIDPYMRGGARFYVACTPGPAQTEFRTIIAARGWRMHQGLVWVKDTMVLGHSDYHYRHEDILYGYKPGKGRVGRGDHAGSRWYGDHSQTTVFEVPRPARSSEHPTMKPIELIVPMIRNSTRRVGVVMDPFGGSGSTLIAAHTASRHCFMAEVDPGYCDVIRDRYAAFAEEAA